MFKGGTANQAEFLIGGVFAFLLGIVLCFVATKYFDFISVDFGPFPAAPNIFARLVTPLLVVLFICWAAVPLCNGGYSPSDRLVGDSLCTAALAAAATALLMMSAVACGIGITYSVTTDWPSAIFVLSLSVLGMNWVRRAEAGYRITKDPEYITARMQWSSLAVGYAILLHSVVYLESFEGPK